MLFCSGPSVFMFLKSPCPVTEFTQTVSKDTKDPRSINQSVSQSFSPAFLLNNLEHDKSSDMAALDMIFLFIP